MLTANDLPAKSEIPDNFYESAILRCTNATFGPSKSSGKPMITLEWELMGVRNEANKDQIDTAINRGGQEYNLAGLSVRSTYHTLTKEAARYFAPVWAKFTGRPESEFSVDPGNPDLSIYKGLAMSAVVKAVKTFKRKQLTDEDKAAGKTEGDIVKDEDGNALSFKVVEVDTFNKRFTGELPSF
jgi:hypothetical protein